MEDQENFLLILVVALLTLLMPVIGALWIATRQPQLAMA
jgi:hypothetical protein